MGSRSFYLPLCSLTLLGLSGCELVVDHEERLYVPDLSGTCLLPGTAAASLRLINAVTADGQVDYCLRPAGGSYPEKGSLASSGGKCPTGIAYGQYTVPLTAEPGLYDLKVVAAGAKCSSAGPSLSKLELTVEASVTIGLYGKSLADARLSALPDEKLQKAGAYQLRFVNLLADGMTVDAGYLLRVRTDVGMLTPMFVGATVGTTGSQSPTEPLVVYQKHSAAGYVTFPDTSSPHDFPFGFLPTGQKVVPTVRTDFSAQNGHSYTLFATGSSEVSGYPEKVLTCDETAPGEGLFATCGRPTSVSTEVFDAGVTHAWNSDVSKRYPAIGQVFQSEADILCLPHIYMPEAQKVLKDADHGKFAHSVFADDAAKVSGDLTDQKGDLPAYPGAACTGQNATVLQALLECEMGLPSTTELDGKHYVAPGASRVNSVGQCAADGMALYVATQTSADAGRCWMCMVGELGAINTSLEDVIDRCITNPADGDAHLSNEGARGTVVYAKQPITESEVLVLPSAMLQRTFVRTTHKLANGAEIDHWCGSLHQIYYSDSIPYWGPYGEGKLMTEGDRREFTLQVERLKAAVAAQQAKSGRRAIISVHAGVGPGWVPPEGSKAQPLTPSDVALFDDLAAGWQWLVPSDTDPFCTFCSDNPLNGAAGAGSMAVDHVFSYPERLEVESAEQTFNKPVMSFVPEGQTKEIEVPLSNYYGYRTTLRISQ